MNAVHLHRGRGDCNRALREYRPKPGVDVLESRVLPEGQRP
jgi:hypothetical protein